MVEGIDIFRERLASRSDSLILIGGAACDDWFSRQQLDFRATKDLDIVLVAEALDQGRVSDIRAFIEEGEYEIRESSDASPILYRFSKPATVYRGPAQMTHQAVAGQPVRSSRRTWNRSG